MNPTLVRIIRERMRSQTTEQLLELWVINDRATWSPEAFDAVRSILAERGHTDLPAQNDSAPLARPHSPTDVPENVYWMGWLRPVLWIGILVSCLTLLYEAASAWEDKKYLRRHWLDEPWDVIAATLLDILLALLLITGSVACFRFLPWSRAVLLTYALVAIPVEVLEFSLDVRRSAWLGESLLYGVAWRAATSADQLVLPLVLLSLLRRPEIQALFTHARPGTGFEPAVWEAPAAARHH